MDPLGILDRPDRAFGAGASTDDVGAYIPARGLYIANVPKPQRFVADLRADPKTRALASFKKGTTTLAMITKDGVIVAVDSRASMGSWDNGWRRCRLYVLGAASGAALPHV